MIWIHQLLHQGCRLGRIMLYQHRPPQSLAQKGAVQRGWRVLISRPHTSKDRKEKTVSVAVRDATRADTILLRVGEKPHLPKGLGAGPWGVEQESGHKILHYWI